MYSLAVKLPAPSASHTGELMCKVPYPHKAPLLGLGSVSKVAVPGASELVSNPRTEKPPDFSFALCHVVPTIHSCDHLKVI